MGLDMFAFATLKPVPAPTDFDDVDAKELHYWRKHPNLHGWMHELYRSKGGANPEFNWASVTLTLDDLDALEHAILETGLPKTHGFFFGTSDGRETDDDLAFIAEARNAVAAGYTVFYTSSW